MNELQKEIFEKHQVRKSRKQKTAFIEFAKENARELGYEAEVEKGSLGARNIVVGDVKSARVVYSAHYDTCPRLPVPNFITPKKISLYLLYQLALVAVMLATVFLGSGVLIYLVSLLPLDDTWSLILSELCSFGMWILVLWLLFFGPANKHTANDNTSGVTVLFEIMRELPKELREEAAFVFFDLEEVGLFGSAGFAKKHKDEMKDKLLVNFDCISDGDNFLFALKKGASSYKQLIEEAYIPSEEEGRAEVLAKGVFYPSDQANFPLGVGACALKAAKSGILYMNRIHTNKDIIYREENIAYFTRGSVKLAELLHDGAPLSREG